jgi:hypothetical protein
VRNGRRYSPFEDSHRLTASYVRQSSGGFHNLRFDALVGSLRRRNEQDRLPSVRRPRSIDRADLTSREHASARMHSVDDGGLADNGRRFLNQSYALSWQTPGALTLLPRTAGGWVIRRW